MGELAGKFQIHASQVADWKKQAVAGLPGVFADGSTGKEKDQAELVASLYQQIGQLTVELDWLKKKHVEFG